MDAAEQAANMMADTKAGADYQYLNRKFGKYELEIQAFKFTSAGKPCIETKVIKAEKTVKDVEPYKVGETVSHLEDIANEKNGGRQRLLRLLLAALDTKEDEIKRLEYEKDGKGYVAEGAAAQKVWLAKAMNLKKQPTAFLRVAVEVEPRPGKGENEGKTFSKERWSSVDLDEKTLDEIEAKRKAANLPAISDAMK